MEGVAPADPANGQPCAAQRAVYLEGFQAVGAAGRLETALLSEQGAQEAAVGADEQDQGARRGARAAGRAR
jgi:hypothetical protein